MFNEYCRCMCVREYLLMRLYVFCVFATFVHKQNENNKKSYKLYRKMWAFYSEPYVLWIYWLKAHAYIQISIAIEQIPRKKAFFLGCVYFVHFYFVVFFSLFFKWKKTAQRNDYSVLIWMYFLVCCCLFLTYYFVVCFLFLYSHIII